MHERKKATEEVRRDAAAGDARRGPRGGTTTISGSGFVKKNFWLPLGTAEELRRQAFETRRSEAEIMREALERHFAEGGGEAP
jgi:hypothetical protein